MAEISLVEWIVVELATLFVGLGVGYVFWKGEANRIYDKGFSEGCKLQMAKLSKEFEAWLNERKAEEKYYVE